MGEWHILLFSTFDELQYQLNVTTEGHFLQMRITL